MMLANASDKTCTSCHADLKSSHYASSIHSFTDGHPQFAPLRAGYQDDQKIKFNHQAHMQKGLKGPDGLADLNCADCHRTPAVRTLTPWRFGTTPQLREASLDMHSRSANRRHRQTPSTGIHSTPPTTAPT